MPELTVRLNQFVRASFKYVVSFLKSDWELQDYPIWIQKQTPSPAENNSRLKLPPYHARIINWAGLAGTGETEQDAMQHLQANFDEAKRFRDRLPRPGTGLPVEFASQNLIIPHSQLADDFLERILNLDWAFLSDISSLWDFHVEDNNDALFAKIREVYGVDVSDIKSGNLVEIFDRIATKRPEKPV